MSQRSSIFSRAGGLLCVLGATFSLVTIASRAAVAQVDGETARPLPVDSSIPPHKDLPPPVTSRDLPKAQEGAADISENPSPVSDPVPAAGETCRAECDYCHCGTPNENNCPFKWFFDGVCDCGCQFFDDGDCFNPSSQDCIGSPCEPVCAQCWIGTAFESNCPAEWCGDGECDCGCQFTDSDCPGGACECNPVCGNGICELACGELCGNCPSDCFCGACCRGDVCTFEAAVDCTGGVYAGNGTSCTPGLCTIGSCCLENGPCQNGIASQCVAEGQSYRPGVDCLTACPICSLTEQTVVIFADAAGVPADAFDRPGNCAIDARQPYAVGNVALTEGWDRMVLFFPCNPNEVGLDLFDLLISATPAGVVPEIQSISIDSVANTATVHLDGPIAPGQWTCITHDFFAITWCAGYLPADASQDGLSAAGDINALIDSINVVPGRILPIYATDSNRSGVTTGADILRLIDLLNGAGDFDLWITRTLPACPSP